MSLVETVKDAAWVIAHPKKFAELDTKRYWAQQGYTFDPLLVSGRSSRQINRVLEAARADLEKPRNWFPSL
jgi:hypothetical protein